MLRIKNYGSFSENPLCCSYLIYNETEGYLIDPGSHTFKNGEFLFPNNIQLKGIILTHCHIDHMLYAKRVSNYYNIPIIAHKNDSILSLAFPLQYKLFFNEIPKDDFAVPLIIDKYIEDGDALTLGDSKLYIIHTPGHSPGSIMIYIPEINSLISGDTIFKNSVGRIDFPLSNKNDLLDSIENKILKLPKDTIVYSGHCYTSDNIFKLEYFITNWEYYKLEIL